MSASKPDGRTARARATRARVTAAATELFVAAGYGATSVNAIAARAGVGEQTVYYAFGAKRAVLTAALDVAVAGDDEPIPTLERPWVREALAEPDPVEQIRRQVEGAGAIHLRAAALLDVVRSAAASDPDLAEVWADNVDRRLTVQRVFAEALAAKGRCARSSPSRTPPTSPSRRWPPRPTTCSSPAAAGRTPDGRGGPPAPLSTTSPREPVETA
ncbi:TetR/AcrR family transcriptional regulator [Nonomuraea recticatena]|uniref:TetR/AcrR family transcriptional regulator n=1 Tax=Nonomuraea recticatena TaxID=46178 RepID=UPI0036184543